MGRSGKNKKLLSKTVSRKNHYLDAVEYLNEEFPFFLTNVLNIGKPSWRGDIDTAAVALLPDGDFEFIFNPDFAKDLTPEEMGFVLAHETMHIMLDHLSFAGDFDNHDHFNLAADAVINDYLADQGLELPDGVVTGEALIGEDCSEMSVTEVYQQLERQKEDGGSGKGGDAGEGDDANSEEGGDTNSGQGGSTDGFKTLDSHDWMLNPDTNAQDGSDAFFEKFEEDMPEDLKDMRSGTLSTPGTTGSSKLEKWSEEKGVTLAWKDLLDEIDPEILADLSAGPPPRPSFARRPRRLASFPDTFLPVEIKPEEDPGKKREKPTIVMALDTSGSISKADANRFISLAKSIPEDKVNLFTCTFTVDYMPLDLDNPKYRGGGTSFSAIEGYIQDQVINHAPPGSKQKITDYPGTILVVTDGEAYFNDYSRPSQKQLEENWHWLLTDDGTTSYLKYFYKNFDKVKKFALKKFINKG